MADKSKRRTTLLSMEELQCRPCEVDGRPAFFHRWVEDDRAVVSVDYMCTPEDTAAMLRRLHEEPGFVPAGCHFDVIRETFALVEYEDGTVAKVRPELITFAKKEMQK